jgi:glyoxylase-like metal-dependent hydrolase (beta-lactamase superfamily II)
MQVVPGPFTVGGMKLFAVLWLAVACSGSSPLAKAPLAKAPLAKAPLAKAPVERSGHAARFRIGGLEAYALEDGHLEVPNDGQLLGFGRPPSETAEVLAAAGLARDTIRLDIQCLLVKAGERVLLFDTGTGDASFAVGGHLPQSLAVVGIAPAAVTDIFISHAHGDHVGGLVTKPGGLAFPAATIHMSAPEWAALQADAEDDSRQLVAAIAGKVSAFAPGAQLLPSVKAVATPGHTPGHSSYEIGTGADKLFYLGDAAHHWVISVQRPAWSIEVDADRPAAEAMRQRTLARLAAEHARVFAGHFPFTGVGQVVAHGDGFAWRPGY